MATDALDPGPEGDYPYLSRNADGTLDTTKQPLTPHYIKHDGRQVLIDPQHTTADGRRVDQILPLPSTP